MDPVVATLNRPVREAAGRLSPRDEAVGSSRGERFLVFLLPTLSALGPLFPVAGSIFAFRLATLLFLVIVLVRKRSTMPRSRLRTSVWILLGIALIATVFLSVAHGIDTYAASELNSCFFGVVLLIGVLFARIDSSLIKALMLGWTLAVTVTGALALYELRTGWRASNYFANRDVESVLTDPGLASSFGNPNDFAYFLLIGLLILLAAFAVVRSKLVAIVLVAYLLLIAFLIQRTESTLGFVVLGTIVLGIVLVRVPLASIIVVPSLAILALVVSNTPGGLGGLLGVPSSQVSLFSEGQTGAVRLNLLSNGLNFASETSFLGLGPGGYETRTAEVHPGDLPTREILSPHSATMEILSQYGIFVFAATVAVVLLIANAGWRAYRAERNRRSMKVAGMSLVMFAILAPLMTVMASSSLEPSYSWMSFASVLLIALWLLHGSEVSAPERATEDPVPFRRRAPTRSY